MSICWTWCKWWNLVWGAECESHMCSHLQHNFFFLNSFIYCTPASIIYAPLLMQSHNFDDDYYSGPLPQKGHLLYPNFNFGNEDDFVDKGDEGDKGNKGDPRTEAVQRPQLRSRPLINFTG